MEVKVRRITDWSLVLDSARWTINKKPLGKEPSDVFKSSIMMAEHSPIRCLRYIIEITDIECWSSQHIARHDAFAGHTVREGAQDTHFVSTSRTDRTGIDRKKLPQDAPVSHMIELNANDLINISTKRLCKLASPETRHVWEKVKEEIAKIDPQVAHAMVPTCIYRGFCPEINSCGYANTEKFANELLKYRSF